MSVSTLQTSRPSAPQLATWLVFYSVFAVGLTACGGAETEPTALTANAAPAADAAPAPPSPDGIPAPDQPDDPGGANQPGPDQPGANQPGSAQPGAAQPGTAQPGTAQPGTAQPGAAQPGSGAGQGAAVAAAAGATPPTQADTYRRFTSSPAESALQEGLTYLKAFNYFDARQRFQAATQADASSASAWYNLGLVQFRTGNYQAATASLNKAIGLNPTFSRAVLLLSVVHLRDNNTTAAMNVVDAAIARRKGDVMLLIAKAQVLTATKQYRQAIAHCVLALKIDYDNPEVLRILGASYLGLKQTGLARLALNQAFAFYTKPPKDEVGVTGAETPEAKTQTEYQHRAQRGSDGLRGVGAEGIDKAGGLAQIYYLFGRMALDKQRYEEARRHFVRAVEYRADYPEAWNNLGVTWLVAKKGAEAIEAFTHALEQQPVFFEARLNLGNAYRISKDPDRVMKAQKQYLKAMQQDPNRPAPYFNLAVLYLENKELAATASSDDKVGQVSVQIKRYQKAMSYFAEYRSRVGQVPREDPLNSYIQECKNLIKMWKQTREDTKTSLVEQEKEKAEREAERLRKEEEDAKKRAAEEAKAAAAAAAAAAPAPATDMQPPATEQPPTTGPAPGVPPTTGPAPGVPPTSAAQPAPPDGGTPPPPPPTGDGGGGTPPPAPDAGPPAPPGPDANSPEPGPPEPGPPASGGGVKRPGGGQAKDKKPAPAPDPAPPAPPTNDDLAPPPPGGDDTPPPPPPPGQA